MALPKLTREEGKAIGGLIRNAVSAAGLTHIELADRMTRDLQLQHIPVREFDIIQLLGRGSGLIFLPLLAWLQEEGYINLTEAMRYACTGDRPQPEENGDSSNKLQQED